MAQFQTRLDLANPTLAKFLTYQPIDSLPAGPARDAAMMCCSNQKIATTGTYQNFQFFGVMVVVAACAFLVLTSYVLELAVGLIRDRWPSPAARTRQLARDYDSRYWLLRMALQGAGVPHWRRGGRKHDNPLPIVDQSCEVFVPRTGPEIDDFYRPGGATEDGGQEDVSRTASVQKN